MWFQLLVRSCCSNHNRSSRRRLPHDPRCKVWARCRDSEETRGSGRCCIYVSYCTYAQTVMCALQHLEARAVSLFACKGPVCAGLARITRDLPLVSAEPGAGKSRPFRGECRTEIVSILKPAVLRLPQTRRIECLAGHIRHESEDVGDQQGLKVELFCPHNACTWLA